MNKARPASKEIPLQLKIVVALFFVQGAYSLVILIKTAIHGPLVINLGLLCIFIGFGLLRLTRGWQIVALLYIAILVVITPLFIALAIVLKAGVSSLTAAALFSTLLHVAIGVAAWRVLTNDAVHQLFVGTTAPEPPQPRIRRSRPVFDEPEGGLEEDRPRVRP